MGAANGGKVEVTVNDEPPRTGATRALLRGLAVGLSVHRLYPDNPDAVSFKDACERVRKAAAEALELGPVRVEVRSGRFLVEDQTIADAGVDRLAQSCFERRAEVLGFDAVPSAKELWSWYQVLSTDPGQLEDAGGMETQLQARGVTAITTTPRRPVAVTDSESADLLGLADWIDAAGGHDQSGSATGTPADIAADAAEHVELTLEPGDTGPALYERLKALAGTLPNDGRLRSTFFQRAARVVGDLSRAERAVFGLKLIDRLTTESFAEQYAGHLSDVALADLIGDVAWFLGQDPAELASDVARKAARHDTLARLFETSAIGLLQPVSTEALDDAPDDSTLAEHFPDPVEQGRELAAIALVDVLLSEPREEHLTGILDNLTNHLRGHVQDGAHERVHALLATLDIVAKVGPPEIVERLGHPREETLDPEVVAEAFHGTAEPGAVLGPQLLGPFGVHAVGPLIHAIANHLDDPARPRMLEALTFLSSGHLDVIGTALDDQPPEVALRLVSLVSKATGADVVALLTRVAARAQPLLLPRVIDTLTRQDAGRAAPLIVDIVRATGDHGLQDHGIDALAGLPNGAGRDGLEALASKATTRPLPRRTRRRARKLARRLGKQTGKQTGKPAGRS